MYLVMGITGNVGGATARHLLKQGKQVRVIELGSMVSADEVAGQLGEVLAFDVKAFAIPRAGWAEALQQLSIPEGRTGSAEEMYERINAGWMDLGMRYGARSG